MHENNIIGVLKGSYKLNHYKFSENQKWCIYLSDDFNLKVWYLKNSKMRLFAHSKFITMPKINLKKYLISHLEQKDFYLNDYFLITFPQNEYNTVVLVIICDFKYIINRENNDVERGIFQKFLFLKLKYDCSPTQNYNYLPSDTKISIEFLNSSDKYNYGIIKYRNDETLSKGTWDGILIIENKIREIHADKKLDNIIFIKNADVDKLEYYQKIKLHYDLESNKIKIQHLSKFAIKRIIENNDLMHYPSTYLQPKWYKYIRKRFNFPIEMDYIYGIYQMYFLRPNNIMLILTDKKTYKYNTKLRKIEKVINKELISNINIYDNFTPNNEICFYTEPHSPILTIYDSYLNEMLTIKIPEKYKSKKCKYRGKLNSKKDKLYIRQQIKISSRKRYIFVYVFQSKKFQRSVINYNHFRKLCNYSKICEPKLLDLIFNYLSEYN